MVSELKVEELTVKFKVTVLSQPDIFVKILTYVPELSNIDTDASSCNQV